MSDFLGRLVGRVHGRVPVLELVRPSRFAPTTPPIAQVASLFAREPEGARDRTSDAVPVEASLPTDPAALAPAPPARSASSPQHETSPRSPVREPIAMQVRTEVGSTAVPVSTAPFAVRDAGVAPLPPAVERLPPPLYPPPASTVEQRSPRLLASDGDHALAASAVASRTPKDPPREPEPLAHRFPLPAPPPLPAARESRRAEPAATAPPAIHVTIGRIEVRTGPSPVVAVRPSERRTASALSLDDYLRRRERAGR